MADRSRCESLSRAVLAVSLVLAARSAVADPGKPSGASAVVSVLGIRDPRLIRAVGAAVAEAARKLEDPRCQEVFDDFTDAAGRPLAANLEAAGQTGESHLRWLVFRNGSPEACCTGSGVVATTSPGSRFVLICGKQFLEAHAAGDGYAADLIIHEELHSLGLGENPPSSAEITARVIARCGR